MSKECSRRRRGVFRCIAKDLAKQLNGFLDPAACGVEIPNVETEQGRLRGAPCLPEVEYRAEVASVPGGRGDDETDNKLTSVTYS